MSFYSVYYRPPWSEPDSEPVFVALVPAESVRDAIDRAERIGIKDPLIGRKEPELCLN